MNTRSTYILLGLVVAALGGLAIYVMTGDDKPAPAAEGYLMKSFRTAGVKPDEVNAVEFERPGQTPEKIVFTRDKTGWKLSQPAAGRLDSQLVTDVIGRLLDARTEKSAEFRKNLADHGLESPGLKVTLKARDNLTSSISFGNVTIGADKAVVYVTIDNSDKALAVLKNSLGKFFGDNPPKTAVTAGEMSRGMDDYRPMQLVGEGITDGPMQVKSMRLQLGDQEIALFRDPSSGWKFRKPADYGDVEVDLAANPAKGDADINSLKSLISNITALRAGDGKDFLVEKDLSKFGLDPAKNKPLRIDIVRDDDRRETVYIGDEVKDAKSQAATDRYFARNEGDSVVARVNAGAVRAINKFLKNPSVLRDKTFAKFNPAAVDAIDVTANGETFELRRIGSEWKVYDADGSPRTANPAMVGTLVGRFLARGLVTGFPDAAMSDDRKGLTKPAATVRVYENSIVQEKKIEGKEPEKTPAPAAKPKLSGTPVAVFDFGNKDVGDVVYARRTAGEVKADLFVPLELLTIVSKPRMEYLDASIKPFAADGVTRITFTRGKETFDIERADDKKPAAQATWKLNGPESMKGRAVDASKVFEMLNQLAFLKPARIAADRPKDDVLNRLEVNPAAPRCKVTVKLAGAPDRVYDFGGDVGTEKKNVYLKSLEENLVFEVDRAPFDLIQKADVLDTVVHRIDVAKIKGFKVKGWSELLGSPTTIEVVRDKDGKWKLITGGMFEVDPAKVDQLLTDLTAPKADSFVALKTGPKPEYNLDPAKTALEIDLDAEGGAVKMVLGTPKDGKIHATSSLLPGDVFLLTDKFNWLRAKPAALKKD